MVTSFPRRTRRIRTSTSSGLGITMRPLPRWTCMRDGISTIFGFCWRVSFSRHGTRLLNFGDIVRFEEIAYQQIHLSLIFAPERVQSVRTCGLRHVLQVTLLFSTSFFTELLKTRGYLWNQICHIKYT